MTVDAAVLLVDEGEVAKLGRRNRSPALPLTPPLLSRNGCRSDDDDSSRPSVSAVLGAREHCGRMYTYSAHEGDKLATFKSLSSVGSMAAPEGHSSWMAEG